MMRQGLEHALARWEALAPREKLLLALGGGVLLAALGWWLLVGPALATLRAAPAQRQALDAQLQRMMALQAQAQSLQAVPRLGGEEAGRQLELATRQVLGTTGRIAIQGDRITVTLAAVAPDALARWLAQARANARLTPTDAHLTRNSAGQWDGPVSFTLPAR